MLGDISVAENIYIACGYTDMRKSIDGLASIVQQQFHLDPFSNSLFLFCGRNRDRMKALLWEGDGFILLYKRLENGKKPQTNGITRVGCLAHLRRKFVEAVPQKKNPDETQTSAEIGR